MKLTKLLQDYLSSYDYKQLRDETKVQYKYFANILMNTEVEGKALYLLDCDKITTRMAKTAYNEWCDRGIHLANHAISITRILFNHGVREELCQTNPFAMVRKRAAERRKVVWGRDDVQKFLDEAYADFSTRNIGLIAQMAYEWCQRLVDMRLLTWDSIDFDAQTVHVKQTKRKAEVFLPVSDELYSMLVQQQEDFGFQEYVAPRPRPIRGKYEPYTMYKLPLHAREVMDAAGLSKELRLSDLRRTGTTEMVDAGVGMAQIMSVTGHANPQSVQPYLKNTLASADRALTDRKIHAISISSTAKESD
jgi:integrase|tara:strand:+ start:1463 stop:2380 length:918 start_codon:yes stop_codon:yes gene_type:complete